MLHLLKPQDVRLPKIRLGPGIESANKNGDGGYVANAAILDNSTALYTYGVGCDFRFEIGYSSKYNVPNNIKKPVFLYDHTVNIPPNPSLGLFFKQEGLGFQSNCKCFLEHYHINNVSGDVCLKVDIEGGEYDYFNNASIKDISLITTGILLEIHDLHEEKMRDKLVPMLEKLYEFYTLTHIHGNNWAGTYFHAHMLHPNRGIIHQLPVVLELTLINKRLVRTITPCSLKYPIEGLDVPNNSAKPDYMLDFLEEY